MSTTRIVSSVMDFTTSQSAVPANALNSRTPVHSGQPRQLGLGLLLGFRLVPHSIEHLHDSGLQPIIGVGQRRGQRFDGRFADLPKNLGCGLTNLVLFGYQERNERRDGGATE